MSPRKTTRCWIGGGIAAERVGRNMGSCRNDVSQEYSTSEQLQTEWRRRINNPEKNAKHDINSSHKSHRTATTPAHLKQHPKLASIDEGSRSSHPQLEHLGPGWMCTQNERRHEKQNKEKVQNKTDGVCSSACLFI